MLNFELNLPTKILFGRGSQRLIGEAVKPFAKKILLHYGGGSVKKNGIYDDVTRSLRESGVEFVELGGVAPNPRLSLVYEGIKLVKDENVELALAVGGGSVIDSAKAIAMGALYDGDVWDIYEKGVAVDKTLPVATVLTIPAAGSEASPSSVITNEKKKLKLGYTNEITRPVVSSVNPEHFFTLPKNQMANGVSDMMSHIFERYFTRTLNTDLTDALCEATLRVIMRNALILVENSENYEAWSEIGFCGTVAHNNSLGLGREQDWASHGMEHELSAIYDVAHGAGLAVVTPGWMRYVCDTDINSFVRFAVKVMGVDGDFRDPNAIASEGIKRLQEFYKKLGLPSTIMELGIDDKNLEIMAKKATRASFGEETPIGNFRKLRWLDVFAIYKSVFQ
ncbi:MAG: iron-containing alcohol dehydrogenase [Clostridiales bacterium]|jgi:alcohol dehydrogenase YqhD (iron-dependent ADH family)|nr:iron-containing alcohol dehydrogenase [Clostridiales bacterium]